MADSKIDGLNALLGLSVASNDKYPIVDASADETKYITHAELIIALGFSAPVWGGIGGTLSNQTDLAAALALKANLISPVFTAPSLGAATCTTINAEAIDGTLARVTLTRLDQFAVPNDSLDVNGQLIKNGATPIAITDLATKGYVDSIAQGTKWKDIVRVATTANGTFATAFADGQTVDGVVLATGDRILIKNQTDATTNGIYVVEASGAPTRATDADTGSELVAATCNVSAGSVNLGKTFVNTNASITLGVTSLTFVNSASANGAMIASNNGSDIPSPTTFRTNLVVPTGSGTSTGTNTGDQTSIVGITGTAAQFNTACTDANFAFLDTNNNSTINNVLSGYATTVTATGTTTLTVASTRLQYFTGTAIQNCKLPVASTLTVGHEFEIINNSTAAVTVQSSGNNTIVVMNANTRYKVTCILASGTSAASWEYELVGIAPGSGIPLFLTVPSFTNFVAVITGDVPVGRQTADTLENKTLKGVKETLNAIGTVSGAQNVDYSLGEVASMTLTGNATLTVTNPPASGTAGAITLFITGNGTATLAITNVVWNEAGAPATIANGSVLCVTLVTLNGGTSYRASWSLYAS